MSFQFTLQKVMELREREKNHVQSEYEAALQSFEAVASELYDSLKRKEDIEESARSQVVKGTSIYEIQQTQSKLLRLQQKIQLQQQKTQLARENMKRKQQHLMEKTIEHKKYEKMKQLKKEQFDEEQKRLELLQMDEISIRLFASR